MSKITIATLGSHSALDVCRGAKDEGFATIVVVEKGRDKTYAQYFKSNNGLGCVDETIEVAKFEEVISPRVQKILNSKKAVFIPHRSFEVYVNNYDAIEKDFKVPIFGNRKLLRFEERTEKPNQYNLLEEAGIKYPRIFDSPDGIDCLAIVKVAEKERSFERAFFLTNSRASFNQESQRLIKEGRITESALKDAVIEEFIVGVQVNFNFFYSPINNRLELTGTDTRRQTNIEGILRLPQGLQQKVLFDNKLEIKYEEAGHIAVTVLESLLEQAFEMGEKFVSATREIVSPGVIGPFSLQSVITPGPPKKDIYVFDVSPRMPGSPGISSTPYGSYLFGKPISMGRRVAMEIKQAEKETKLDKVTT